jgi:DNA-binding Lrp family transcriptional regulator
MTYDDLDRKLVNALLGDGRATLRGLADELDVSVSTISGHVNQLTEAGIIDEFTPIVNYEALGYDVTAIIKLKVAGSALPEFTDELKAYDQLVSVYEVTGNYDIVAIGKFVDTDGMNDHLKEILAEPDIIDTNTSVVLDDAREFDQFELDVDE